MKWSKQGLIYCPDGEKPWMAHSALVPTPLQLDDERLRIYIGIRDKEGQGRIGYVDVKGDDPSKILNVSYEPVLDIGENGCFDDSGVTPNCVVQAKNELRLYYSGYQQHKKTRFTIFGGMAVSKDGGETFQRYSKTPVSDRTNDFPLFHVISWVMPDGDKWRIWRFGGGSWLPAHGKDKPKYLFYADVSYNGFSPSVYSPLSSALKKPVLEPVDDEFRFGRACVLKEPVGTHDILWRMFYSVSNQSVEYKLGYAESKDGWRWTRKDDQLNLNCSDDGWDSHMICYSGVVRWKDKVYCFYNGNKFGETGFGYAVLEEW